MPIDRLCAEEEEESVERVNEQEEASIGSDQRVYEEV